MHSRRQDVLPCFWNKDKDGTFAGSLYKGEIMSDDMPKPTTLASLSPLLKDVYEDYLVQQLSSTNLVFGGRKFPPLTRKQKFKRKWKRFWNHIPDFIKFIRSYEYIDWQYKE
jgi:hypothetical protein